MSKDDAKKWNIALWIVQVLLAFAFAMAGMMKLTTPPLELGARMSWVYSYPRWMPMFLGDVEIAAALGLILPSALRILPKLTAAAAAGLVCLMLSAAGYHATHGELAALPVNAVLGGLAAFVLWGRLQKAPIQPRG